MSDATNGEERFRDFFIRATGIKEGPYPYQRRLAECDTFGQAFPQLLGAPTGVGKTASVILGWVYRRRKHPRQEVRRSTPRRLVYCLPMRTLVEQTRNCAMIWLDRLGLLAGTVQYTDETRVRIKSSEIDLQGHPKGIGVFLLMGGVDAGDWDEHPERDVVLIGTQDMLLSRALNRGYGMSRYRWPMHFGLLNNDCLWVMDETQLMGVGLTTTAQLQGLRAKLATYGVTHSLWMSATLDRSPIRTVDHPEPPAGFATLTLTDEDRQYQPVTRRLTAPKPLARSDLVLTAESEKKGYARDLAAAIRAAHRPGTLTLAVLNRVSRAQGTFAELQELPRKAEAAAEVALIHARFRPLDRKRHEERLFAQTMPPAGRIVIATQAIEAGVDVSAATMFTELAPWPSLVQRFGRCNRGGEFSDAHVIWIDVKPKDEKDGVSLPYAAEEFERSRQCLSNLTDVGPASLERVKDVRPLPVVHALRRKDLLDLWDTTPDLAGNDLDISRFVRDADDCDVQVYWRDWDLTEHGGRPPAARDETARIVFSSPDRRELCAVGVGRIREFLDKLAGPKNTQQRPAAWRWNPLDEQWQSVDSKSIRPGMVLVLHSQAGGYDAERGWTGDSASSPVPVIEIEMSSPPEALSDDDLGDRPVRLTTHLCDVAATLNRLRSAFGDASADIPWDGLARAACWHDVGKAHPACQAAMRDSEQVRAMDPEGRELWAKSGSLQRPDYRVDGERRRGFRHELAGMLAWLHHHTDEPQADLIAFLIAAHHGKVRLSLRSLPNENRPADSTRRFARRLGAGPNAAR